MPNDHTNSRSETGNIIETDVLIIGAGIAGCSTAFWLADEGVKAVIVEKGSANGQASGGNAGSMHVQLLSFDYGAKAEAVEFGIGIRL